jgi:hypothetical protein
MSTIVKRLSVCADPFGLPGPLDDPTFALSLVDTRGHVVDLPHGAIELNLVQREPSEPGVEKRMTKIEAASEAANTRHA